METTKELFSIQYASNFSGVGLHTIRAWERRYKAVEPNRTDSGRRSYTQDQLEKLRLLKSLTNKGNSISQIAHLDNDELASIDGQSSVDSNGSACFVGPTLTTEDLSVSLDRLKAAVSFKKIDILAYELEKLAAQVSLRDLCIKLVMPFLKYLGDLYENGNITVAEEHAVSSILKFHLGSHLYCNPTQNIRSTKKMIFAAPEGELHEFGILLGALLAKHYGIKFFFLGANLPNESLLKAANDLEVDVVVLGITNPAFDRNNVNNYISQHFKTLGSTQLWIGGRSGVIREGRIYPGMKFIENFNKLDEMISAI